MCIVLDYAIGHTRCWINLIGQKCVRARSLGVGPRSTLGAIGLVGPRGGACQGHPFIDCLQFAAKMSTKEALRYQHRPTADWPAREEGAEKAKRFHIVKFFTVNSFSIIEGSMYKLVAT